MPPSLVTRRSAIATIGLVGLVIPGLGERQANAASSPEQQPHMRAALEALRNAKRHLELADADKGGHRVKAVEHVNAAITETEAGIAYAAGH